MPILEIENQDVVNLLNRLAEKRNTTVDDVLMEVLQKELDQAAQPPDRTADPKGWFAWWNRTLEEDWLGFPRVDARHAMDDLYDEHGLPG